MIKFRWILNKFLSTCFRSTGKESCEARTSSFSTANDLVLSRVWKNQVFAVHSASIFNGRSVNIFLKRNRRNGGKLFRRIVVFDGYKYLEMITFVDIQSGNSALRFLGEFREWLRGMSLLGTENSSHNSNKLTWPGLRPEIVISRNSFEV